MAKPKRSDALDPAKAMEQIETPRMNWKVIAQIAVGFLVLWVLAAMAQPYIGIWGYVVVGVLTAAALGLGIYVFRMTRKSAALIEILREAKDPESRKLALERLQAQQSAEGKDAMNALAQAQLLAQESPQKAIAVLEKVDLEKAPAMVADDIRANLGLFYLAQGRAKDARKLADAIRLDRQPQAKAKAMYAAVMAEAFARTGAPGEAMKLLATYSPDDESYGEVRLLLHRARVYAAVQEKKRGLAKRSLEALVNESPEIVQQLAFVERRPEINKLAKQVLGQAGRMPRPKFRAR
ncbi:MAG: urea transporter [Sandaracinaceae bacterium]|nr:urea transporter [Sandaracinaceae bacterium]